MSEEPEGNLTFEHFVNVEILDARMAELGEVWTREEVAATCYVLAISAAATMQSAVPALQYADPHKLIHRLCNLYASDFLTLTVKSAGIAPDRMYIYALETFGHHFTDQSRETEDIAAPAEDIKPMTTDEFNNIWNPRA